MTTNDCDQWTGRRREQPALARKHFDNERVEGPELDRPAWTAIKPARSTRYLPFVRARGRV